MSPRRSRAATPLAADTPPPHSLREHALLADGERGALIGPEGDVVWMCFPRWHDRPFFVGLLGGRSVYAITPEDRHVWGGYYEPGTLIWRSRWVTQDAIVECREALAYPGSTGRAVLLRRIECLQGTARMRVRLHLCGLDGRPPRDLARRSGVWTASVDGARVTWGGAPSAHEEHGVPGALVTTLTVREGTHRDLVLVLDTESGAEAAAVDSDAAWTGTATAWRERVPELGFAVGERDARHAVAVLSGLTSSAGGTVAAATTSLPERYRRRLNFDYRYVWIRDQCYIGLGAAAADVPALLDSAVRFVSERLLEDGHELHPAYCAGGGRMPEEHHLHVPGYPGGGDVAGNQATDQFQLDSLGESLRLLAEAGARDRVDDLAWRAANIAADAIESRWREPDAGIWELEPQQWTHSRLVAAAGLRAAAEQMRPSAGAPRWLSLADRILADTSSRALHATGRWQRAAEDERVDCSLLLGGIRGAVPADDPRTTMTLASCLHELTEDGYAYRFRADARPLGSAEGAFLLCGFWVSLALLQQGDRERAARWFERSRAACGPPGLFSEEFDVRERQLRGNLPQAFVHATLLECAAVQGSEG